MAQWAVTIPAERYEEERLYQRDLLTLPAFPAAGPGDEVLVLADEGLVALGRVLRADPLQIAYGRRFFDAPRPVPVLAADGPVTRLSPEQYSSVRDSLGPAPDLREWLVSVDLPIEAATPAEAVRLFWTYVAELGPRELPAFVWPRGDELAMQAYVLGGETTFDPEED